MGRWEWDETVQKNDLTIHQPENGDWWIYAYGVSINLFMYTHGKGMNINLKAWCIRLCMMNDWENYWRIQEWWVLNTGHFDSVQQQILGGNWHGGKEKSESGTLGKKVWVLYKK